MTISVALPVYNGANYLREALESLVGQGLALAEIVIADNCSSDATADIVREFAVKDPRVRHERSEVFLNQADNISRAVQLVVRSGCSCSAMMIYSDPEPSRRWPGSSTDWKARRAR